MTQAQQSTSGRSAAPQKVKIAAGAKPPEGFRIEFATCFVDPPESGSLVLLCHSGKCAVVEALHRGNGGGEGDSTSSNVLEALGCVGRQEFDVYFMPAGFRDWMKYGKGAKSRVFVVVAQLVAVVAGIAIAVVAEMDAKVGTLIVVLAVVALIAEVLLFYHKFKSLKTAS